MDLDMKSVLKDYERKVISTDKDHTFVEYVPRSGSEPTEQRQDRRGFLAALLGYFLAQINIR